MQDKLSVPKPMTICRVYTSEYSLEVQVDTDAQEVIINAMTDLTLYSARYDIDELHDWFAFSAIHVADEIDITYERESLVLGNCGGYRIVALAQGDKIAFQLLSPIGSLIIAVQVPVNTFNEGLEFIAVTAERL